MAVWRRLTVSAQAAREPPPPRLQGPRPQHPPSRSHPPRPHPWPCAPALSGVPAGSLAGVRATDGDGCREGRQATRTSYLLPSAAGKENPAAESRLIFRGGAERRLTFRRGVSAVHAGTYSSRGPLRPQGPLRRRVGRTGARGASLAHCVAALRPGVHSPVAWPSCGRPRGRPEGSRKLTGVSRWVSVAPEQPRRPAEVEGLYRAPRSGRGVRAPLLAW